MAISFVGSLPPVGANNGGNVTLTFANLVDTAGLPATLLQDDLVICAYASSITSNQVMATSSSGWTNQGESYANGTTYDTNLSVWTKKMGAVPDTTFVATGPGGSANGTIGVAAALRGVDTTTPLDVAVVVTTGTGSSRPNPGSITPLANGAYIVVVGAGSAGTGAAFTNPGDLSTTTNHFRSANHAETNDITIGLGLKTNWTSGAFDGAAWTGGTANAADSWVAIALVIRPQASVTTTVTVTAATMDYAEQAVLTSKTAPVLAATMDYVEQATYVSQARAVVAATMDYAEQPVVIPSGVTVTAGVATIDYAEQFAGVTQARGVTAATMDYAEQATYVSRKRLVLAASVVNGAVAITVLRNRTAAVTAATLAFAGQAVAALTRTFKSVAAATMAYATTAVNVGGAVVSRRVRSLTFGMRFGGR